MSSIQKMIAAGGHLPPRETTDRRWMKRKQKPKFLRELENRPSPPPRLDLAKVEAAVRKFSTHH